MLATEKPSLIEENRRLHKAMVEGIDVEFYSEDGTIRGDKVRVIDFDNPAANDWLAMGQFTTPDISILSDEFLAEVQQLEKKNLALEALRELLNDEIRSRSKTNVVETKRFSERLESAIARYHTNAISTVEVMQELIELAKEVRAARKRGEDEGLSQDEIAFYDALAESESAVELMGNDSLKLIAHELLVSLKGSASVD